MKNNFEQQLRKDILKRNIFLSVLLVIVFFCSSLLGILSYEYHQIISFTQETSKKIDEVSSGIDGYLTAISNYEAKLFLASQENKRIKYTNFYNEHGTSLSTDLDIVNVDFEEVFSTNNQTVKSLLFDYLKTVCQSVDFKENPMIVRIFHDLDGTSFLLQVKPIRQAGKIIGYGVVSLSSDELQPLIQHSATHYVVMDQFNNCLLTSSEQFVEGSLDKFAEAYRHVPRISVKNGQLVFAKKQLLANGLELFTYNNAVSVMLLFIVILILVGILSMVLLVESFRISKTIAKRNAKSVNQLVKETELIVHGYQMKINMDTGDEFEYLATQINKMINILNRMHHNTLLLEKEKRQMEKLLLDAQFRPHFLYNTLETMRVTCFDNPKVTEALILSLNRILRYSVDDGLTDVILEDDLEVLEEFMYINSVRYQKFSYVVDVEESLLMQVYPKLFLLPLVENALKYGMQSREDLEITIKGYVKGDKAYFDVCDNGAICNEEAKERIYQQINGSGTLHGISNIIRRLQMMDKQPELVILREHHQNIFRIIVKNGGI
ncbi:Histidine kinase [Granulicatella balaenopterae]|uniref:Histidine kinase n=1 Tax=Granulicatella balaenopterae TaxID=137733 RepID=A0A1H9GVH0_9LACT|nr:histidine kinase [Granulicatella balaenopterae]SEQ54077.1 Histidine kinase [Granulicatella balaenopterae]